MKKIFMHGIPNLKKTLIILEKSWDFVQCFDKTTTSFVYLTASFQATGSFNDFKMHAYINTLLLLHLCSAW